MENKCRQCNTLYSDLDNFCYRCGIQMKGYKKVRRKISIKPIIFTLLILVLMGIVHITSVYI